MLQISWGFTEDPVSTQTIKSVDVSMWLSQMSVLF